MMDSVTTTVDLNAKPRFMTLAQIRQKEPDFDKWELRNDMVKSAELWSCDHGFLALRVFYKSGAQDFGGGYRSEGNIGLMMLWLARLWDVYGFEGDLLKAFKGIPIRVLFRFAPGGSVSGNTYLGNFMQDRFIKGTDLVMAGIVEEGGAV